MDDNYTYLLEEYEQKIANVMIPNTVFYIIILTAGVIGNASVLYVYSVDLRRERTESRYFIPILSLFDFLVCIISAIWSLSVTYRWLTFNSEGLCKTMMFFVCFTLLTSNSFLLAIAVQRYTKICRPFGKQMTFSWRRLTVVLVISVNFVLSLPTAVVSGVAHMQVVYKGHNISGSTCLTGNKHYRLLEIIYYSILIFFVIGNIIVTAGLYAPIARIIYKKFHNNGLHQESFSISSTSSSQRIQDICTEPTPPPRKSRKLTTLRMTTPEANFNLMFFTVITVYVMSYIPASFMLIFDKTRANFWTTLPIEEFAGYNFLWRLYFINHATNPFIYAYFDLGFRSRLRKILRRESEEVIQTGTPNSASK